LTIGSTSNSRADGTEVWTDSKDSAILIINDSDNYVILANGWGNHIVRFPLTKVGTFKKMVTRFEAWFKIANDNAIVNASKPIGKIGGKTVTFRIFDHDGMLCFPNATPLTLEQAKKMVELIDKQLPELNKRIETADLLLK